jgi:hypothetical protein
LGRKVESRIGKGKVMKMSQRPTTRLRHEKIRKRIDAKVEELKKNDVRNPVEMACRELMDILGYSERYLRDIYFGY